MKKSPNTRLRGHQVVCSAFIAKDKKVLIFLDPKFKVWRVPGGRPEHGETLEVTLLREMKEETGIDFVDPRFAGWGYDQQFKIDEQLETSRLLMYFLLNYNDKQTLTIDAEEAEEHKWVTIEELKNINDKEGALTDFFERNPDFEL